MRLDVSGLGDTATLRATVVRLAAAVRSAGVTIAAVNACRAGTSIFERAWRIHSAPVAKPKGKVGTTTSGVLETKVCAFVKRGFTRDEWRKWLPPRAPYPSKLSKPCG
jgi:hypothetical protein